MGLGKHRSLIGVIMNGVFGIFAILLGVIGYVAVLINNERLIRIFWYLCVGGVFAVFALLVFGIIEFAISKIYYMVVIMSIE